MKGKCYGGLARMYTAVKNVKEQEENVLWLNAGDFYQVLGTKETSLLQYIWFLGHGVVYSVQVGPGVSVQQHVELLRHNYWQP